MVKRSGQLERTVSLLANGLTLWVTFGGIVVTFFGGFFTVIWRFPLYWRIPFLIFASLFALSLGARGWLWFKAWRMRRATAPPSASAGISQTMVEMGPGASVGSLRQRDNVMSIVQAAGGTFGDLRPLPSTPEFTELKAKLREFSQALNEFLGEREKTEPIHEMRPSLSRIAADLGVSVADVTDDRCREWADRFMTPWMWEKEVREDRDRDRHSAETHAEYRQRFDARAVSLFLELQQLGRGNITTVGGSLEGQVTAAANVTLFRNIARIYEVLGEG